MHSLSFLLRRRLYSINNRFFHIDWTLFHKNHIYTRCTHGRHRPISKKLILRLLLLCLSFQFLWLATATSPAVHHIMLHITAEQSFSYITQFFLLFRRVFWSAKNSRVKKNKFHFSIEAHKFSSFNQYRARLGMAWAAAQAFYTHGDLAWLPFGFSWLKTCCRALNDYIKNKKKATSIPSIILTCPITIKLNNKLLHVTHGMANDSIVSPRSRLDLLDILFLYFASTKLGELKKENWKLKWATPHDARHTFNFIVHNCFFFPEKWAEVYGLFRAFGRVKPRMLYIGVTCVLCEKSCDPHGRCDVFSFFIILHCSLASPGGVRIIFYDCVAGHLVFFGRLDKCEMRKIDGSSETKLDILWMFTQTNDERRRRRTVRATTKLSRQARSLQLSSATKKKS